MKFVQLILWPGGAYTDDTYATEPESRSHIRIHFMNHGYIGSFFILAMPIEPKTFNPTWKREKSAGTGKSTMALKPICKVNRSPKQRVAVALQKWVTSLA